MIGAVCNLIAASLRFVATLAIWLLILAMLLVIFNV